MRKISGRKREAIVTAELACDLTDPESGEREWDRTYDWNNFLLDRLVQRDEAEVED